MPRQELLDDHQISRLTKDPVAHDAVQGLARLLVGVTDYAALARRQAAGLDHDGSRVPIQVAKGCLMVVEHAKVSGGDVILAHKVLAESL